MNKLYYVTGTLEYENGEHTEPIRHYIIATNAEEACTLFKNNYLCFFGITYAHNVKAFEILLDNSKPRILC